MSAQQVAPQLADDDVFCRTAAGQRAAIFGVEFMHPDAMRWLLVVTGLTPVRALAKMDASLDAGRAQLSTLLADGLIEPVPAEPIHRSTPVGWRAR